MARIWWILIQALESLSNLHFDWSLLCKVYTVWPKMYRGVIFHDTKGELTHGFKNDIMNLVNFHQGTKKSENLHFNGLLLSKVYNIWAKKVQRS